MKILNTRNNINNVRELIKFAKEHSMSVYELIILCDSMLGIDVTGPRWIRVITRIWLELDH
jgi:hypothetical protein